MRSIIDIPLDQITILNPRERDPARFKENVDSIARVGLKRPIVVNTRFLRETSKYELVCGQGRIEAVRKLGWPTIPSLIVDVDRPTALIMSIAENAARQFPPPIWFANMVKELHDSGMSNVDIGATIGKSADSVGHYLKLITQGDELLITAVEQGKISARLAYEIASATDPDQQTLLLTAYQSGTISGSDLVSARRLLESRKRFGKKAASQGSYPRKSALITTVEDLRKEIKRTLVKQEEFVQKSQRAENRLMLLAEEFNRLRIDPDWREILHAENLTAFPKLKGDVYKELFEFNNLEE